MQDIETEIQKRIHRDPEILAGKPVIRGTRIPVYVIIDLFWNGVSEAEIVDDYPTLSLEDVRAALAYHLRETSTALASA
ncbi:MAG TPA: DUF433 domain-containing protein [Thermomicrobiales bacterium]|nr:DUF433 domain-containing protein [Thermomicrobiales bacterium]